MKYFRPRTKMLSHLPLMIVYTVHTFVHIWTLFVFGLVWFVSVLGGAVRESVNVESVGGCQLN